MTVPENALRKWLNTDRRKIGRHAAIILTERDGARRDALPFLKNIARAHYVDPAVTAQRLEALGAVHTATLLRQHLPTTPRAKSGDIGEILATEVAEDQLQYRIPIRRLRWKDGRDMALRGDDFIGVLDNNGALQLLKGESKSRSRLSTSALAEAGRALDDNYGRPNRHSVVFVADRLREQDRDRLATRLETAVLNGFRSTSINHMLFVLSGTPPAPLLTEHLERHRKAPHLRYAVAVQISDHGAFIDRLFKEL